MALVEIGQLVVILLRFLVMLPTTVVVVSMMTSYVLPFFVVRSSEFVGVDGNFLA